MGKGREWYSTQDSPPCGVDFYSGGGLPLSLPASSSNHPTVAIPLPESCPHPHVSLAGADVSSAKGEVPLPFPTLSSNCPMTVSCPHVVGQGDLSRVQLARVSQWQ